MTPLRFTAAADADFEGIIDFLRFHAGAATAERYLNLFGRLFQRLQHFPDSGASRPLLGRDVRIGVVRPYVVLYRHDSAAAAVSILRIVNGRRKIDGKLLKRLN